MITASAILLVWYFTAMWFLRRRHKLRKSLGPAYFIVVGVVLGGIPLDVLFNWIVAPFIFLDLPKELLFTGRLQRYREDREYLWTWRSRWADFICEHILNPFDPRGKHC
jgi:hypothetical protein